MIKPLELINVSLKENLNIDIVINPVLVAIMVFFAFAFIIWRYIIKRQYRALEINEAELGIGSQKIKLKPNYSDMQVAFKFWVEISTRKIALPIDIENDIIFEIYKSWFEFFKIAREHIKEIPVNKIRSKSTKKIINITIGILNNAIRLHLTKWQGKFNRWYLLQLKNKENEDIDPQILQKKYKEFDMLVEDLYNTNLKLMNYKQVLEKIFSSEI